MLSQKLKLELCYGIDARKCEGKFGNEYFKKKQKLMILIKVKLVLK